MNTTRRAIVLSLACSTCATGRSVVVTQTEERASSSLWLFSMNIQQNMAHQLILDQHDVTAVAVFNAKTLAGVDVCYMSPSLDELQLTTAEIDALEAFVIAGGRLVVSADHSIWAVEFAQLAARFEVFYGRGVINGFFTTTNHDLTNPIINGAHGTVNVFGGGSINDDMTSTNDDFEVAASWTPGPPAIGYIEVGAGQVVFLSDFNSWDNDMIADHDNETMWLNLFALPPCHTDLNDDGVTGTADLLDLLGAWGFKEPGHPADFNGDSSVNTEDLLILLDNWGLCPQTNDCNTNGIPDDCDIAEGTSEDFNSNGIPDECEETDCNRNGVPDLTDIADRTSPDCNANFVPDECDIADGTSDDLNGNGIPDECDPPCPWDLSGTGAVGTGDLLLLLSGWGLGGPADFNQDGTVTTADLLELLGNWGPCP